jgi:DnaJ-class molecular chaperone
LSGSGRGDQFAHVKVVVPRKLSERQRELFEQLATSTEPATES